MSWYTFPWHHGQTSCSPVAHPGTTHFICFFCLLLQLGKIEAPPSYLYFFLAPQLICWCLPKGIFCSFQLSLPIAFIGDWVPKVLCSLTVWVEENWNQVKPVLWSWMSQRQLSQIPWPFVPEATQLGNWMKRTISLQIKRSVWAELSWASELQWLKNLIWAQDLIITWVRW